jgi:Yip1 domain
MDLIARVRGILLDPQAEWPAIERESGDPSFLFTTYVAVLALIPALAGFIGTVLIGVTVPVIGTVRMPLLSGLFHAVFGYVLTFVIVYVVAIIVDALAPTFGGQKNFQNALKLTVYSYTPAWLAGIFLLIPGLRFLTLLSLYGLYLLYTGLPPLMKAPKDKALMYSLAVVVGALVLTIAVAAIQGALFSHPRAL